VAAVAAEARANTAPGGSRESGAANRRTRSRTAPRNDPAPESLRLAFVVQRYGEDVNGGAEYHCRLIAEHLARQHRVEVLTSCAKDYITWKNEHPPGLHEVGGVLVRRFKVKRPRDPDRFGRLSQKVFLGRHSDKDELDWLDEQGPTSPALLRFLKRRQDAYDYILFFPIATITASTGYGRTRTKRSSSPRPRKTTSSTSRSSRSSFSFHAPSCTTRSKSAR
jgi:hypothetical protein